MPRMTLLALCLATGCYSGLEAKVLGESAEDTGGPTAGENSGGGDDGDSSDDGPAEQRPDPSIHDYHLALGVRRLSKFEYGNTVRDLLGVEGAEAPLTGDQKIDFLSNNAHAQRVGLSELEALSRAADTASKVAMSSLTLPSGCALESIDGVCVRTLLATLLPRAFRRPATAAEVERYAALFEDRVADGDLPQESFRIVVEAVLMSPNFLYRPELGSGTDGGPLGSYEIASRLSYLLWGSMPDAELFDVAASGMLRDPQTVKSQAKRMLTDDKAATGTVHFVAQWLGFDEVELSLKADEVTADFPETLAEDLEQEAHLFVTDALLGPSPSLYTLLSSTTTYANKTIAQLYGLEGAFGEDFERVELDPEQRRGLLTLPLVIAAHAKESGFSVVQMGRFIREHVLCQEIPPPPPDLDPSIDDAGSIEGESYRELLTRITSEPACAGCHTLINPPGFAYLPYDPIGSFSEVDSKGRPFEAAGMLNNVDGETTPFDNAAQMAEILADSGEVRACFVRKYIEYAFGRTLAEQDVDLYHRLADGMDDSGGDYSRFVAMLVLSSEFSEVGPFE